MGLCVGRLSIANVKSGGGRKIQFSCNMQISRVEWQLKTVAHNKYRAEGHGWKKAK